MIVKLLSKGTWANIHLYSRIEDIKSYQNYNLFQKKRLKKIHAYSYKYYKRKTSQRGEIFVLIEKNKKYLTVIYNGQRYYIPRKFFSRFYIYSVELNAYISKSNQKLMF